MLHALAPTLKIIRRLSALNSRTSSMTPMASDTPLTAQLNSACPEIIQLETPFPAKLPRHQICCPSTVL